VTEPPPVTPLGPGPTAGDLTTDDVAASPAVQAVVDAYPHGVAVVRTDGRVVLTNLPWEERCADGTTEGAWVPAGRDDRLLDALDTAGASRPAAREAAAGLRGVLTGGIGRFDMEYEAEIAGEARYFELSVTHLPGGVDAALVMHVDVTWRESLEQQLAHRATHDALTGLPNRVLLDDRLVQALVRGQRSSRLVAVMVVDLDRFAAVNDTLGHQSGDHVLRAVARRLQRTCRASDSVTRFGGDEFVVVVEDVDTIDNVRRVAQRVLDSMATPIVVEGSELYLTVSVGVAVNGYSTSASPRQALELLRDADTAMYAAKSAGRHTFVVFEPQMRDRVALNLSLTAALRFAVSRRELRLAYQPVFDCGDGRLVGAEALVRWQHPERGLIGPADFLEAAELSGLIVDIGGWVLGEACRQAAEWDRLCQADFRVHVNVSARQLCDPNAAAQVRHALERHGAPPYRLRLEVTEAALLDDPEAAARVCDELVSLGVGIAVDDFGTGHSALTTLQRFPVTAVKIDRQFVAHAPSDPRTARLVRGVVALAEALGLESVAEGVETEEQARVVRDLGCSSFQGYLRARPGPASYVTTLLEDSRRAAPPTLVVVRDLDDGA
jgi:diguanylate cyclase (GGDEF)-like protein